MSFRCNECYSGIDNIGMKMILFKKKRSKLIEKKDLILCNSHHHRIEHKIHRLEDMANGLIVRIDSIWKSQFKTDEILPEDYFNTKDKFRIQTLKVMHLGYLSLEEAKEYFPKAYQTLTE